MAQKSQTSSDIATRKHTHKSVKQNSLYEPKNIYCITISVYVFASHTPYLHTMHKNMLPQFRIFLYLSMQCCQHAHYSSCKRQHISSAHLCFSWSNTIYPAQSHYNEPIRGTCGPQGASTALFLIQYTAQSVYLLCHPRLCNISGRHCLLATLPWSLMDRSESQSGC